jgi:hypothetical protein
MMKSSEFETRLDAIDVRFDFLEWLILHPRAEEITTTYGNEGWFMEVDDIGEKLFVAVMNRDGRSFHVRAQRSLNNARSVYNAVCAYIEREWPH